MPNETKSHRSLPGVVASDSATTVGEVVAMLRDLDPTLPIGIASTPSITPDDNLTNLGFTVERHGDARVTLIPARPLHY